MIFLNFIICISLIANVETLDKTDFYNYKSIKCFPEDKSNVTHNLLLPRQIFGYGYDFKSVFRTVFRYVQYSFNFIADKINTIASSSMRSPIEKVSYKDYQVLRINAVNEVFYEVMNLKKHLKYFLTSS